MDNGREVLKGVSGEPWLLRGSERDWSLMSSFECSVPFRYICVEPSANIHIPSSCSCTDLTNQPTLIFQLNINTPPRRANTRCRCNPSRACQAQNNLITTANLRLGDLLRSHARKLYTHLSLALAQPEVWFRYQYRSSLRGGRVWPYQCDNATNGLGSSTDIPLLEVGDWDCVHSIAGSNARVRSCTLSPRVVNTRRRWEAQS